MSLLLTNFPPGLAGGSGPLRASVVNRHPSHLRKAGSPQHLRSRGHPTHLRTRLRTKRAAAVLVGAVSLGVVGVMGSVGAASSLSRPSEFYGNYSNGLPTSMSFFPIAVFDQSPSGGNVPAPYTNQAQAMVADGININVGEDNDGEVSRDLAAACAAGGPYMIAGNTVSASSGGPTVEADANANPACAKWIVGYQMGDEPACGTDVAAVADTLRTMDPSRMANEGLDGYLEPESAACNATLLGSDIASGDVYEIVNPYENNPSYRNGPQDCLRQARVGQNDCLWGYSVQTQNMVAASAGSGKPVFVDLDSGTTQLGMSSAAGSVCDATTNLCSNGNEMRATNEQVSSAAWDTLINGSNGLLWFCDDGFAADACLGGGAHGDPANCNNTVAGGSFGDNTCDDPANISYVDHLVESYAEELNTPNSGYCDMVTELMDPPFSTCSGGDLTLATSNSNEPITGMTKEVGGTTYLFVMADRGAGTTTGTYTVSGAGGDTATLVYDSAQHYDPDGYSDQGTTYALNDSGQFSDSLTGDTGNSANAVSYQVKIYAISDGAPSPTGSTPTNDPTSTNPNTTTTTTMTGGPTSTTSPTTTNNNHHHHHDADSGDPRRRPDAGLLQRQLDDLRQRVRPVVPVRRRHR